jgi:hypothetical protein
MESSCGVYHPLSEDAHVASSTSADHQRQLLLHRDGECIMGGGSTPPQKTATSSRSQRKVVGRLRHFDDDTDGHHTAGPHQRAIQLHHVASNTPAAMGVFRTPAHATTHTLPVPSPHGSSENWGMIRRFGFPCSQDSAVCDAEHDAYQTSIASATFHCESLWSAALRGVPLLANATDETNTPLRKLCLRCGIPGHLRGVVWLTLSGVALRLEENEKFCASLLHRFGAAPDAEAVDSIEKDIDRTFPQHPYYAQEFDVGQAKLRRVLHALCWRNPMLNYCQSFNFLAATLLLVTDDEDATFWLMVLLLETILPNDYYGEGLIGAKVDQEVVAELIRSELPALAAHFDEIRFDVRALVPSWLLSMFVNVFPFDTVIRIWDVLCTHADLTAYSRSGKKFGVTGAHSPQGGGVGSGGAASMRSAFPIAVMVGFFKLHANDLLRLDDAGEVMHYVGHQAAVSFDRERLVDAALSVPLSADRLHLLRRHHRVMVRQQEAARVAARRAFQLSRDKNVRNSVLAGSNAMKLASSAVRSPNSPLWRTDGPFPTVSSVSSGGGGGGRSDQNVFGDHRQQSIEVLHDGGSDDYYGSGGVLAFHDETNPGEELQEVFVPRVYEEEEAPVHVDDE